MPSEPPVTSRHFSATENTSCENASVSIRNGMPPVRTQKKPISAAPAPATRTPATKPIQALTPNMRPQHGDRVGAEAEERRVTERHQPGEAEQQVEAHGEDRKDVDLGDQRARVVRTAERQRQQSEQRDQPAARVLYRRRRADGR